MTGGKVSLVDDDAHITQMIRGVAERAAALGLHAAKNLVEAARGELRIKSAPGEGTTVAILLPLVS